jgi:hypothetical protein
MRQRNFCVVINKIREARELIRGQNTLTNAKPNNYENETTLSRWPFCKPRPRRHDRSNRQANPAAEYAIDEHEWYDEHVPRAVPGNDEENGHVGCDDFTLSDNGHCSDQCV